jgi:alpha-beta hydrolase superfamily lysophospholipase
MSSSNIINTIPKPISIISQMMKSSWWIMLTNNNKSFLILSIATIILGVTIRLKLNNNKKKTIIPDHSNNNQRKIIAPEEYLQPKLNQSLEWFVTTPLAERGIIGDISYTFIDKNNKTSNNDESPICLIFMTGWSETQLKYADFIQDLILTTNHVQYILTFDHRSQGLSSTLSRIGKEMSHVDDFNHHVQDTLQMLEFAQSRCCSNNNNKPRFILCGFSLGGLIASHVLVHHKSRNIQMIERLILVAPPFRPKLDSNINLVSWILWFSRKILKRGEQFVFGQPTMSGPGLRYPPHSRVSSSTARVTFWEMLRTKYQHVCINGMSIAHVHELVLHRFDSQELFDQLEGIPILLLTAEFDEFVDNSILFEFAQYRKQNVHHIHYDNAKHELLHERDEIRSKCLNEIYKFIIE